MPLCQVWKRAQYFTVQCCPLVDQTQYCSQLTCSNKKQCDFSFFIFFISVRPAWWSQPASAAAPCPGPACRSWPSSEPAERPWVGEWRRAAPFSTWPGRGRPGWTGCPRPGASPAERRSDGDAGRAPEGLLLPPRAPQTAREEESLRGNLVGGQEIKYGGSGVLNYALIFSITTA